MKRTQERLERIEQHAAKCGLTPYGLLLEAKVHPQYLHRWRKCGVIPSRATLNRILAVEPEGGA